MKAALVGVAGILLCSAFSAQAIAADRPRVMVLYFDNNDRSPAYAGLAKGLADMMLTDLASSPSVEVVEREKLDAVLAELKLQQSEFFDPQTAQRLGRGLGAQYAVTGAFLSIEPTIRIDVRLIRVDTAAVVKAASVTGNKDDFFKLQEQLAAKLIDGLATVVAMPDRKKVVESVRANRVARLTSLADYGRAIDARDRGELDLASKQLRSVVVAEPDFALGKSRYDEIMNALAKVKHRRAQLFQDDAATLPAHIDEELAKAPPGSPRAISYRILRGQYYLNRLGRAAGTAAIIEVFDPRRGRRSMPKAQDKLGSPEDAWESELRILFDNQAKLIEDLKLLDPDQSRTFRFGDISEADKSMAKHLGIERPGAKRMTWIWPAESAMKDTALTFLYGWRTKRCPFLLDPSYGATAIRWLEDSLVLLEKKNVGSRHLMETTQELAKALTLLGRREEALTRLQQILEAYPQSEKFDDTEALLRRLVKKTEAPCSDYCLCKPRPVAPAAAEHGGSHRARRAR